MTAIVGVKAEDGVYIGGDRAVSNCWGNTATIANPKIFYNGPALIGFAGAPRPAQLVQYAMWLDEIEGDEFEWLVTNFIPNLQITFMEHDYRPEEEEYGLIVGVGNRLFTITGDNAVIEVDKPFVAIGDGEPYALGVLSVVSTEQPERAITMALNAAEANCGSVLPPYDILKA